MAGRSGRAGPLLRSGRTARGGIPIQKTLGQDDDVGGQYGPVGEQNALSAPVSVRSTAVVRCSAPSLPAGNLEIAACIGPAEIVRLDLPAGEVVRAAARRPDRRDRLPVEQVAALARPPTPQGPDPGTIGPSQVTDSSVKIVTSRGHRVHPQQRRLLARQIRPPPAGKRVDNVDVQGRVDPAVPAALAAIRSRRPTVRGPPPTNTRDGTCCRRAGFVIVRTPVDQFSGRPPRARAAGLVRVERSPSGPVPPVGKPGAGARVPWRTPAARSSPGRRSGRTAACSRRPGTGSGPRAGGGRWSDGSAGTRGQRRPLEFGHHPPGQPAPAVPVRGPDPLHLRGARRRTGGVRPPATVTPSSSRIRNKPSGSTKSDAGTSVNWVFGRRSAVAGPVLDHQVGQQRSQPGIADPDPRDDQVGGAGHRRDAPPSDRIHPGRQCGRGRVPAQGRQELIGHLGHRCQRTPGRSARPRRPIAGCAADGTNQPCPMCAAPRLARTGRSA